MKPHYYFSAFYNYPYTFGLLFGLGLYARYEEDADGFRSGYDELLSSTPQTLRANSMIAVCMPRQMPKNGMPDSRAKRMASTIPSTPPSWRRAR